ncbi:hypothetical protein KJ632_00825 [Patescibacteria group bacterium]|nr:hypothetical protein [Patescibacteria group bacterium]
MSFEDTKAKIIDPLMKKHNNRSPHRILWNAAKCLLCGDYLVSEHQNIPIVCKCGNLTLNGGLGSISRTTKNGHETVAILSCTSDMSKDECTLIKDICNLEQNAKRLSDLLVQTNVLIIKANDLLVDVRKNSEIPYEESRPPVKHKPNVFSAEDIKNLINKYTI